MSARKGEVSVWRRVAAMRPKRPKIPAGAFTLKDFAREFTLSVGQAKKELGDMVDAGDLKTAIGNGKGSAGHPQRFYWPVEGVCGGSSKARKEK